MNSITRRNRLDLFTPAEKAIFDASQAVEAAGAHPLLTEAVVLLQQAREKAADYVDMSCATCANGPAICDRWHMDGDACTAFVATPHEK